MNKDTESHSPSATASNLSDRASATSRELERLQVELQASRRRLALMLEVAGTAGSWDWDIAARRMTGDAHFAVLNNQDALALAQGVPAGQFFAAIHPDDSKRIRLAVAGILAGAEVFTKEYRLLKDDGGVRWVHANGRTILGADEQPERFIGTLVDITEQKRTKEQLRVAQTAGGIGAFEHAAGFGTVSVSEQFCHLLGLHPTTVLPVRTINLLVHPADRPIIDPHIPATPRADTNIEFRITRADTGEERWLTRRGEYVPDVDGPRLRYIGVIYDITQAKQTEENLRRANEALAARVRERTRERNRVWQNSRDVLAMISLDGVVQDVNPAWSEVLGHDAEEVVGRPFSNFVAPEDAEATLEALRTAIDSKTTSFESRYVHKSGAPRWLSWTTSREDDLIYAYGRHVTTEKEQAEVLREIESQLRQSQKMEAVGQLTGGIAHDFNNMLQGIIGSLDIVRRRIANGRLSDVDRFIDAATTSAQRAAALTHRLLAFSRRQSLERRPVDVTQLIRSMEDLLRRTLGEQIELAVVADADTHHAVTDENQLESAILNLVINARDAMPDGGKLTIETSTTMLAETDIARYDGLPPGPYTVVAVSDTGTGMTRDVIEKAFDPFFTTKPIGQGTGLGLSMIYGFAQQSDGHVRIYSELGKGTTIKLMLPALDTVTAVGEPRPMRSMTRTGSGERVLVVEDDDSVRLLVVEALTELGYGVLEARDANSAIPILRSNSSVDLLITDVGLPGMNGRQLAELALEARPDLKVLFMTGYAATAASRGDFLAPGMEMISKPFTVDDFARRVGEILQANTQEL